MPPLDFPSSPALNQLFPVPAVAGVPVWKWDGTKWTASPSGLAEAPTDGAVYGRKNSGWTSINGVPVGFTFIGKPGAGAIISIPIASPIVVPANLAGSLFYAKTGSTGSVVFAVNKIATNLVLTQIGTLTVLTTTATLAGSGATLGAGDTLQIAAPATQDGTLADVGITIFATRS